MARHGRWVLAALAALAAAPIRISAQSSRDASAQTVDDTLGALRNSIAGLRGALWEFNRDLSKAGSETVLARARALVGRCRSVTAVLGAFPPDLGRRLVPPAASVAADSLRQRIDALRTTLATECLLGLGPDGPGARPDSIRAWSPYRTSLIERSLRQIETWVAEFRRRSEVSTRPTSDRP